MILKRKKCRYCFKLSLPGRAICWDHYRLRLKMLREKSLARKKNRRIVKDERIRNSLKYLNEQAWPIFSRYIRFRDRGEDGLTECFTCRHRKNPYIMQAGHFWHGVLDYDERNIHPQCVYDNKWLHGNLAAYGTRLAEVLGVEGFKQLEIDAHKVRPYTTFDLKNIIAEYSEKLKKLNIDDYGKMQHL
jgi:hypothetical protein